MAFSMLDKVEIVITSCDLKMCTTTFLMGKKVLNPQEKSNIRKTTK